MVVADEKILEIFIESSLEQLRNVENMLLDLESVSAANMSEAVAPVFRVAHSIKGDAGSMGFSGIVDLCHGLESVLALMRDGGLRPSSAILSELLTGFDLAETMVRDCRERGKENTLDYVARLQSMITRQVNRQAGENDPALRPAASSGEEEAPDRSEQGRSGGMDASGQITRVNIPAQQLDVLVDQVGELAIAQVRLSRMAAKPGAEAFMAVAEEVERLSSLLRNQVLEMRMLPIKISFSKYRRLVWELASSLNKEAELVMKGENTELDKTIIEQLNTPLIHMLRNSIHHGIEPPQEREKAGKSRKGTITLSARQEGNEVVLELADDGRGIDGEALYAKAVSKKLVEPGTDMGYEEKQNLVFLPGLSTASKVTEVSGRGVGMDAVRETLAGLRGKVGLSSVVGRGSVFTIRLPISLAIVDCLQVEVDRDSYFFHLDYVEECLELPVPLERYLGGARTFDLRGEVLPLLSLRDFFRTRGEFPPKSQVVVINVPDGRFGVVVDEVLGQQQAVLKQLGPALDKVDGVLGATVTDDGHMALILDASGLARTALEEKTC